MEKQNRIVNVGEVDESQDPIIKLIEKYVVSIDEIDENLYLRGRQLLFCYKNIVWGMLDDVEELNEECDEILKEDVLFAIEVLDLFDPRMNSERIESKLTRIQEVHVMSRFILMAALKVREYPKCGDKYYQIIERKYLRKYTFSEEEICEELHIGKSTMYRFQKRSVRLFSYCLWKMILPQVKKESEGQNVRIIGKPRT